MTDWEKSVGEAVWDSWAAQWLGRQAERGQRGCTEEVRGRGLAHQTQVGRWTVTSSSMLILEHACWCVAQECCGCVCVWGGVWGLPECKHVVRARVCMCFCMSACVRTPSLAPHSKGPPSPERW